MDLTVGSTDCAAAALAEDVADIVLGVRPAPGGGQPARLGAVPAVRARSWWPRPGHPLAGRARLGAADLAGSPLADRAGRASRPGSEEERWADRAGPLPDVEEHESEAAALVAVRSGAGVLLALGHAVAADLRRGTLVRLPVEGTPVTGLWWATVPGDGRATSAARALQRFLTTPDATTRPALPAGAGRTA